MVQRVRVQRCERAPPSATARSGHALAHRADCRQAHLLGPRLRADAPPSQTRLRRRDTPLAARGWAPAKRRRRGAERQRRGGYERARRARGAESSRPAQRREHAASAWRAALRACARPRHASFRLSCANSTTSMAPSQADDAA